MTNYELQPIQAFFDNLYAKGPAPKDAPPPAPNVEPLVDIPPDNPMAPW